MLGQRTAELHLALAADHDNPSLAPEPFTTLYQRAVYQSLRSETGQVWQALRRGLQGAHPRISGPVFDQATDVLSLDEKALECFRSLLRRKILATRIRCHNDYDLAQSCIRARTSSSRTWKADPAQPPSERRIKRSPLRDVAGMLWSFYAAGHAVLLGLTPNTNVRLEDVETLEPWANFWITWAAQPSCRLTCSTAAGASFMPSTSDDMAALAGGFILLERAIRAGGKPTWTTARIGWPFHCEAVRDCWTAMSGRP